jgi:hypothetical protein
MAVDTIVEEPDSDAAVGYDFAVPDKPNGPVVRKLLRRTAIAAALGATAAMSTLRTAKNPGTKAAALGALAPGAGYVLTRSPLRLTATLAGFATSLVGWFATGNVIAPPAIWAVAAIDARRQANGGRKTWSAAETAVPLALAGSAIAGTVARRRAFRAAQERGRVRAEYLATAPRLDPRPRDAPQSELSVEDLATQRGFLDRGLQPLDQFDGFDIIEQFQTSAIRYQLYMSQWVLALSQLHHTPSFHGYLSAAQRNLIDKLTLPRVWRYWAFEQTWGNLSLDWDPMKRDNIMLSGYLGVGLGAYESTTGDARYREAGALPFRLGKRTWPYTHDMVARAVSDNMQRSSLTLFPCEPNWVYNMCNMSGINTLMLSDRLHGTRYVDTVGEDFGRSLREEFVTPDGRVTAIRSARLGFTIPMLTSTLADCTLVTMLHAFDPELAQRCWAIVRREFVDTSASEPRITLRGWDAIDTGNFKKSEAGALAAVMWAAAEMGDTELYAILEASLDRRYPPSFVNGARWFGPTDGTAPVAQTSGSAPLWAGASTQVNAILAVARFSPPGGYRAMIEDGPGNATLTGPLLADASYPEVLVASARTDGRDLRLVLRPGDGGGRVQLGFDRLRPGGEYVVNGALQQTITAGTDGRAALDVDLGGRVEVNLSPR